MVTTSDNNIYFSAICCFVAIPSTIIQISCFRYKKILLMNAIFKLATEAFHGAV